MGWDAAVNRKLAVPLVPEASPELERIWGAHMSRARRTRSLKERADDPDELRTLMKLADTRQRLERLKKDIDALAEIDPSDDLAADLDYVNATIGLGLLEVMGELSEIESSDELLEEAAA